MSELFDDLTDYLDIDSGLTHSQRVKEQERLRGRIPAWEDTGLIMFAGCHRRICRHEQGEPFTLECAVVSIVPIGDAKIQRTNDGQETMRAALEKKRRLQF